MLNFSVNGRQPKLAVLFHFGGQFTAVKLKLLLKTKISTKPTFLGISNSVSSRVQKNHKFLVKLNKKTFWAQLGPFSPINGGGVGIITPVKNIR